LRDKLEDTAVALVVTHNAASAAGAYPRSTLAAFCLSNILNSIREIDRDPV